MEQKIQVNAGNVTITQGPAILQSLGLGSCVAICIYDKVNKIGGLAHIMSPNSKVAREGINPLRFADKAVDQIISTMEQLEAIRMRMEAKIFGGASMFPNVISLLAIGESNISAVRKKLAEYKIKIVAEDLGGNTGRSIWFDLSDGSVVVTMKGKVTMKY